MLEPADQHLSATSRSPLRGQTWDQKIAHQRPSTDCSPELPSTPLSIESSSSEPDNSNMKKPSGSNADGGTYTYTHHGCTLRFKTPAMLQRHKREVYRQSVPLADGSAPSAVASQAGLHWCDGINLRTNKPCNTTFSQSYDLTRHENTIHKPRKKVNCPLCKGTFGRTNALNRHLKVCKSRRGHPPKLDDTGR